MPVLGIPHTNITLMVCFSCLLTPRGEATAVPSSDHLTVFTSLRTQTLPQICTHQKKNVPPRPPKTSEEIVLSSYSVTHKI